MEVESRFEFCIRRKRRERGGVSRFDSMAGASMLVACDCFLVQIENMDTRG